MPRSAISPSASGTPSSRWRCCAISCRRSTRFARATARCSIARVVYGFTDHGEARLHSMKNYMVFTAGSGGGRMKTGYHLAAEGDAVTRVGLTIMQAFGIPNSGSWGTESNHVTKPFSEVLV